MSNSMIPQVAVGTSIAVFTPDEGDSFVLPTFIQPIIGQYIDDPGNI